MVSSKGDGVRRAVPFLYFLPFLFFFLSFFSLSPAFSVRERGPLYSVRSDAKKRKSSKIPRRADRTANFRAFPRTLRRANARGE